jgi:anti-sigma regulatory factor (Ser/Thr protein kinase)
MIMALIINKIIKSSFVEVNNLVLEIVDFLNENNITRSRDDSFRVNFMLREVLNNSVEHGNKFDEDKRITVKIFLFSHKITFEVEDEGEGHVKKNDHKRMDSFVFRERSRGISTLENLNFNISIIGNKTTVTMFLEDGNDNKF